ncbi:MAG: hypothetical protein ACI8WP_000752 [Flavobacteriaceae bacterium]
MLINARQTDLNELPNYLAPQMGRKNLIIIFFCLNGFLLEAQELKQEREVYLDRSEMPGAILELLDSLVPNATKLKYLQETDGAHESYEVKFDFKHRKYSIEFSKELVLEDVEVDIHHRLLPHEVKSRIDSTLTSFQGHKINKIQKQFSSNGQSDEEIIEASLNDATISKVCYELEVSLKIDNHWEDAEMLFDANGYLIKQRKIIKRESDFIDY